MSYAVKEIFLTLQGEGAHAGRAAVFCRFSGCNLWSGREQDRFTATCRFCDADFVGTDGTLGGRYASADELADTMLERSMAEVQKTLDHKLLNRIEAPGMPTLENISRFIWERVQLAGNITRVSVHRDSCNESCTYFGPQG